MNAGRDPFRSVGERYRVEWISDYKGTLDECHDPDLYFYSEAFYDTRVGADEHGRNASADGPCPDYFVTTRQVWDPDHYEPGFGAWEDVDRWIEGVRAPL